MLPVHLAVVSSANLWPQTFAGAYNSLFAAPNRSSHASWLSSLRRWRDETRAQIGLSAGESGEVYGFPSLAWTQTSIVQPQVHTWDLMLWNESSGRYTVDRYLDNAMQRYGGMDSVLLWPTYPNIGTLLSACHCERVMRPLALPLTLRPARGRMRGRARRPQPV